MVYLVARDDRCLGSFEAAHDLLSVADFTIEAFHLVFVVLAS